MIELPSERLKEERPGPSRATNGTDGTNGTNRTGKMGKEGKSYRCGFMIDHRDDDW
jgi:hypothetical protein